MLLNELLKSSYNVEYDTSEPGEFYASFLTEDKREIKLAAVSLGPFESWEVDFGVIGSDGSMDWNVTNKGDAFKIFATIIEILKNFLTKSKPKSFYFTAKEPSRKKLYQTMMDRFLKSSSNYTQITDKEDSELKYVERTNSNVFLIRKI